MDEKTLANTARGFIDSFATTLSQENLNHFSEQLKKPETHIVQRGPLPKLDHQTLKHLQTLVPAIENAAMKQAALTLDWGQVYKGGGIDPVLAEGMFAAQAVGTYGVFKAREVASGLFLLAPGVYYPPHTHAAREVYHCLAGEIEITHKLDKPSFTLEANQSSETPSGRLHSLRTGNQPVLLAYIWSGELIAPTWWWDKDNAGQWQRTAWKRPPGKSWIADKTEPVSDADSKSAMV